MFVITQGYGSPQLIVTQGYASGAPPAVGPAEVFFRANDPGRTFAWEGEVSDIVVQQVAWRAAWKRTLGFDFTRFFEFTSESPPESIASVNGVTITPSGPTLGAPAVQGFVVAVPLSGVVAGTTYVLDCTITTNLGNVLSLQGQVVGVA